MKKRKSNQQKSFLQSMIHTVLIIFLIFGTFHSCQEDENVLVTNPETFISESGQLKSVTISIAAIDALILKIENYVTDGELEPGIANALISKLENAKKSWEKGNEKAAMNQLQAVVSQLESLVGNGTIDSEVGEEIIFETEVIFTGENPTFIDLRDGKEYKTILIGEQVWMAENLAYKTETGSWAFLDDERYIAIYGRLYNWDAAMDACPEGWHLPSDAEWTELETFLIDNGYGYEGSGDDIAKSLAATTNWTVAHQTTGTPGIDLLSNNSSGFSALPGGYRSFDGYWFNYTLNGTWWSSTDNNTNVAWYRSLSSFYSTVIRSYEYKEVGFSVRCVRD